MTRLFCLLALSLGVSQIAAASPREVSIKKIVKLDKPRVALGADESTVRVRVKTGEWIAAKDAPEKRLKSVKSAKADRTAFDLGTGSFVAHLASGPVTFKVKPYEAPVVDEPAPARRMNPDVERYTTNGVIDFRKLHAGHYGGY